MSTNIDTGGTDERMAVDRTESVDRTDPGGLEAQDHTDSARTALSNNGNNGNKHHFRRRPLARRSHKWNGYHYQQQQQQQPLLQQQQQPLLQQQQQQGQQHMLPPHFMLQQMAIGGPMMAHGLAQMQYMHPPPPHMLQQQPHRRFHYPHTKSHSSRNKDHHHNHHNNHHGAQTIQPNASSHNHRRYRRDRDHQWLNYRLSRNNLGDQRAKNGSSRIQPLCKRLVPAPYNTTQFLMDDHNVREPELGAFSKLLRKSVDESGEEATNGEEVSASGGRLNDRLLHTLNDESSSEEFYSSPDDEQDFMEKQFSETYDNIHAERLDLMSKAELMQEYLLMEERVNALETQLKLMSAGRLGGICTEEEEEDEDAFHASLSAPDTEVHLDEESEKSEIHDSRGSEEDDDCKSTTSLSSGTSSVDERAQLMAQEIQRLTQENAQLRAENQRLVKMLEGKENIADIGLLTKSD